MIWVKCFVLFGEPQWAVVGDTFPVGCAYSDKVVYPEYFKNNPDFQQPTLINTELGVYEKDCGLRNVNMSWGHDEYVYQMMKDHIPEEGLYMLRYHSFYAWHREGEYSYLLDDHDRRNVEMGETCSILTICIPSLPHRRIGVN